MVKRKVVELEGAALDWAVAKAIAAECHFTADIEWWQSRHRFAASSSYMFGGHLVERLEQLTHVHGTWYATPVCEEVIELGGETPLAATCRAIVAAELGDEVEIPEELA